MESLLAEYKETLRKTRKEKNEIIQKLSILEDNIEAVKKKKINGLEMSREADLLRLDQKILSSMIRDLEFSVQWLSTGRQPGNKKGIDHLAAYQKEKPFDPFLMQLYAEHQSDTYEWELEECPSDIDKEKLSDQILSSLSVKEKEIYLLAKVSGYSQYEIATLLDMPRTTVMNTINRCERKIKEEGWMTL